MKIKFFNKDNVECVTHIPRAQDLTATIIHLQNIGLLEGDLWEVVSDAYVSPITPNAIVSAFERATDEWLDMVAQERKYRDIVSAVSYRGSPVLQFDLEANYLFGLREKVWLWAAQYMREVLAGERAIPTGEQYMQDLVAHADHSWPVDDIRPQQGDL